MKKQKARQFFIRLLLGLVVFFYIFSIVIAFIGTPESALAIFAFNSFFAVIVYFLLQWQKKVDEWHETRQEESTKTDTTTSQK